MVLDELDDVVGRGAGAKNAAHPGLFKRSYIFVGDDAAGDDKDVAHVVSVQ